MADMIRVAVGNNHYRTKSFDRVARRLYGPKAQAVVDTTTPGKVTGVFVTPDRNNPSILRVREHFEQEEDLPVGQRRKVRKITLRDTEGHSVTVYR